jgi:hypothetical protein
MMPSKIESLQCRTARYCPNWCADEEVMQDIEMGAGVYRPFKRHHDEL